MSTHVKPLSEADFQGAVAHGITFVDFWAPWCAPCREVAPIMESLAAELQGKVAFGKVNVDDNTVLSERYDVLSMPTLMLFKDGQPVEKIIGSKPKDELKALIQKHL
jgi:thioredoxin 1